MNPALLITVAGPLLGTGGWLSQTMWLFWVGVAICVVTLILNMASGVMRLPVLPVLFMAIAAGLLNPWYLGLGMGLIAWTAFEAVGELIGQRKQGRL